jgi:hypothetical protein
MTATSAAASAGIRADAGAPVAVTPRAYEAAAFLPVSGVGDFGVLAGLADSEEEWVEEGAFSDDDFSDDDEEEEDDDFSDDEEDTLESDLSFGRLSVL